MIEEASNLLSDQSDAPFAIRHSTLLAVSAMREPDALTLLGRVALNPQPLPPREPMHGPITATVHGGRALEAGTILALDHSMVSSAWPTMETPRHWTCWCKQQRSNRMPFEQWH